MSSDRPIAISLGDPAGIGPEIIAKAFRDFPEDTRDCFVAGDVPAMRTAMRGLVDSGQAGLPVARIEHLGELPRMPPRCVPVWQVRPSPGRIEIGRVSPQAGALAADCVVWAANAALRGELSALVTAPLHKEALAAAGPAYSAYPGHTELLQSLAAAHAGCEVARLPVRMMLANDELRTVLVSIHLSLRAAIDAVSFERVFETIRITHEALSRTLGRAPHIAVAGLNPHAGEGGLFGSEEIEVIAPAVAHACSLGMAVSGPLAPDTVFMRARRRSDEPGDFDVVVAMYHDQGLIPVKYLGVDKGVNVTLGLPFVRTSPDHGTAFDIAGQGVADPASLVSAIRVARELSAVRVVA